MAKTKVTRIKSGEKHTGNHSNVSIAGKELISKRPSMTAVNGETLKLPSASVISKASTASPIRDLTSIADRLVSITDLGRGKAASVVSEIAKNKKPFLILKNNKPKAAIIDIEQLNELLEDQENYRLLLLAQERMRKYDANKTLSREEILKKLNITEEEIKAIMDDVEIE